MVNLYELREGKKFSAMTTDEKIIYFTEVARKALPYWGYAEETELKLLNYTENATFEIKPAETEHFIMRVHRALYTTENSIKSEFAWLESLRKDKIHVPQPIINKNGEYVVKIQMPEYEDFRYVDCTKFEQGDAPLQIPKLELFKELGEIIGKVHNNSEHFKKPEYYNRIVWNANTTFSRKNNYHYEYYKENSAFNKEDLKILDEGEKKICQKLETYGQSSQNYGLIHSDFRFSNILLDKEKFTVLDFDDCGEGWYMYDLGSVLAFNEDRDDAKQIMDMVFEGYSKVRTLRQQDLDMFETFQLLRRYGMICVGMFFEKSVVLGAGENADMTNAYWNNYYKSVVEATKKYLSVV